MISMELAVLLGGRSSKPRVDAAGRGDGVGSRSPIALSRERPERRQVEDRPRAIGGEIVLAAVLHNLVGSDPPGRVQTAVAQRERAVIDSVSPWRGSRR